MRILVIEDDKDVASFIRNGLVQAGCNVDHAANGRDGLFLATTESYDALVIDRMLPGIDGLTVIRTLRASSNTTPVLILSALGEVDDRVNGLKAGGDDYLVKLAFKSNDLRFAQVIGLTQFGSRVYAKFDAVKVGGFRYPIDSIYKMSREEARDLARSARA